MTRPAEASQSVSAEDRRRLLAEMLQKRASRALERPLSLGQERLRLMASLDPGGCRFNIAVAYRVIGPLDRPALEQGVTRIAQRHEVLRATFSASKEQPMQRIGDLQSVFSLVDLGDLPAAGRAVRASEIALEVAKRPFDLVSGPLWRVTLLRASDLEHVIVIVMHHIVSDAWSFYVFSHELAEFYEASLSGRPPRLADLPIQYADFGQRQRQWLTGPVFEQQLAHWRSHLEGDVPRLLLPTDRPGSVATNHRGAFQTLSIPAPVVRSLGELSKRETATMFMTLMAGFEVLLHQYSGQKDLVLCTPASGRHRSQTKDLIGYFNNILPMRFSLEGDPTFVEIVRRTRKVSLDSFKYQDLPFQVIADFPNLKAVSLSRVLFSLDIEWPPKFTLPGLTTEAWAVRTETADFDLSVSLWLSEDEIHGVFEYKSELFDDDTIGRMIRDYCELLTELAANPETALSSLTAHAKFDAGSHAASSTPRPTRYRPPGFPTDLRIVKEWEEILDIRPIGLDDDLFELGATSLSVARLTQRLRGIFEVDLPLAAIFQARTVERISALIRSGGGGASSSALAPIQPAGTRPPLFLCEGIGVYYPLVHYMDRDQPVYGLVTEVAGNYTRVEDLAASYIKDVRGLQAEGPYYLGGLSFGGIVALEMAQQLTAAGQEVGLLALFDTATPWAFTPRSFLGRVAGHLSNLRRFGFRYASKKFGYRFKRIRRILERRMNPFPASPTQLLADNDRLRHLLSTTADEYQLRPYAGRTTLFVLARRDGMSDSLFDPAMGHIDSKLGWGRIITGQLEVQEVPGEHVSMFYEPHVKTLAEKVASCLETARQAASKPAGESRQQSAV